MSAQSFFTREEAALEMRVSTKTIQRAIASGHLRAKRTGGGGGGRYLISRAELDAWFAQLEDA